MPSRYAYQGLKSNLRVSGYLKPAATGTYSTSNCAAGNGCGSHAARGTHQTW
jgi:hypothetical protein